MELSNAYQANLLRLEQALAAKKVTVDSLAKDVEPLEEALQEQRNTLQAMEEEEHNRKVAYLNLKHEQQAKIREHQEAEYQVRRVLNLSRDELKSIEAELDELKRAEMLRQKMAELEADRVSYDKWDALTAGAPWREWAKDYQIKGAHFICENRFVILADPMGLGKTLSSVITVDMAQAATKDASPEHPVLGDVTTKRTYDYETRDWIEEPHIENPVVRPVGRRVLYICPSPLIKNVENEWRMWAKNRNVTFIGGMTRKERMFVFDFILPQHEQYVVICNYEAWRKDNNLINELVKADFDTLIIDEAHNIKEMKTSAYRGISTLVENSNFDYIIPMTGTPILNRPQELYPLLHLLNPNDFYSEGSYLRDFCQQDRYTGKWSFQEGGLDRISKRIRKNFLRRTREEVGIQLPPKTITIHELERDEETWPEQAKVRTQMRDFARIVIDENEGKEFAATAMIALLTRLRQIETWPAGIAQKDPISGEILFKVDVEQSQKIDYIIRKEEEWEGLIPNLVEDDRIVVFSQFTAPLEELAKRVRASGRTAVILNGDTPKDIRDQIMMDVDRRHTPDRTKSKWDVVLANYKVGGVGMNMTAMTQMIILDEEWNPGKRDQAYDRLHRIGQEDPVTIHVIRNLKTVDDWLAGLIAQKEEVVDGFTNAMVSVADLKQALDDGLI